jgi:o-succinylbenzoate synthase
VTLAKSVEEYRVRLPASVGNAHRKWIDRRGLLLTLQAADGHFGQGEAAPLPGYSEDDFDGCEEALSALEPAVFDALCETPSEQLLDCLRRAFTNLPPAARFAAETAILDLRARRAGLPLHRSLQDLVGASPAGSPLPLVTLLGEDMIRWEVEAREALEAGYAGLKAKVGRSGAFERELRALQRVRACVGDAAALRLDANGAFPTELARERLTALATVSPELVEEPLSRGTPPLEDWPVAVALDESLRDLEGVNWSGVAAAVIKLGVLGGFSGALAVRARAEAAGAAVIVSHTFEGPVGTAAALELALALGERRHADGLGVHAALAGWRCPAPAAYSHGKLAPHAQLGLGLPRVTSSTADEGPR